MQAGVPVIISKQSGAAEILNNVIKVDYWNVKKMAKTIVQILNDSELGNNLGKEGKREASNLDWKYAASDIRQIYQGLVP